MRKTPPIIHYSQLEYKELDFHPFRRVRGVCYYEGFWRDTLTALVLWSGRVLIWLKKNYRKELVVAFIFSLGFMPHSEVKALPLPKAPYYIQPVAHIQPVTAVAFVVPETVAPIVPPPLATPVSAPVAAPVSSGCTNYHSGDYYLDKIINYESTGNSCATNYLGCFGLLQACPGEPLRVACGGNPTCQIAWFQANKTGGRSWAQVWQHELDFGWW